MKLRSKEEFISYLDGDLSWRKHELTDLKFRVLQCDRKKKLELELRVAYVFLYAHWEGFLKKAGAAYFSYVARKGIPFPNLTENFISLGLFGKLYGPTQVQFEEFHSIVRSLLGNTYDPIQGLKENWALHAEDNLNSKVLARFLAGLGLDSSKYLTSAHLIDSRLLGNRNPIAHGDRITCDRASYLDLHERVIELLNAFNNDLQNCVSRESYRRALSAATTP